MSAIAIDACVGQHIGDRREQQDRLALLPHPQRKGIALVVLADGVGGHAGGAQAAEQVLQTAEQRLAEFLPEEESAESFLRRTAQEMHTLVHASHLLHALDAHSTVVMLLIQPDRMSWLHCGDSRLYRFRDGVLQERTRDHSYVEVLLEHGRIQVADAADHPERNILVSSLGGREPPRLDFNECAPVQAGDAYVLCSDGLWAYFSDVELGDVVHCLSARQGCESLIQLARHRAQGGGDNLSLAIIRVEPRRA